MSARPEVLQLFRKPPVPVPAAERCDFCGVGLDDLHGHIVDLARRALICVCRPCYLLFTFDGAGAVRHGAVRFRAVPDRYVLVPEFAASRDLWDALQVPIELAFFLLNGSTGRATAFYPSPAGATESELPLDAWQDAARVAPALGGLVPDVEALLVRRTAAALDAVIVPIDACYELVGRIRVAWRGLQGGDEVGREVDRFFARVVERARAAGRSVGASGHEQGRGMSGSPVP